MSAFMNQALLYGGGHVGVVKFLVASILDTILSSLKINLSFVILYSMTLIFAILRDHIRILRECDHASSNDRSRVRTDCEYLQLLGIIRLDT